MGWLFLDGYTRPQIVERLTGERMTSTGKNGENWESITHRRCLRGNVLWAIQENIKDGVSQGKFIACYLIGCNMGSWGYKMMDESMGPGYYTCPVSWLDEVDVAPGEFALSWRDKVRRYHEDQKVIRSLKAGERVLLLSGCTPEMVDIASTKPFIGVDPKTKQRYRIPKRMIDVNATKEYWKSCQLQSITT